MAKQLPLSAAIDRQIARAVDHYINNQVSYERLARRIYAQLQDHEKLAGKFHSIRYRVKDPKHLRNKLQRKARECLRDRRRFNIDQTNVQSQIEDLAGVRLIHLHTNEVDQINKALLAIFKEISVKVLEGPIANTWDDEYREIFKKFGIATRARDSMYTSVHYVVQSADGLKCEIQVRTLMEEIWGEVSHRIDYPAPSGSLHCSEQIKVLARFTSGCTRLVDSIFLANAEHATLRARRRRRGRS